MDAHDWGQLLTKVNTHSQGISSAVVCSGWQLPGFQVGILLLIWSFDPSNFQHENQDWGVGGCACVHLHVQSVKMLFWGTCQG